jgi:hypothetical protein
LFHNDFWVLNVKNSLIIDKKANFIKNILKNMAILIIVIFSPVINGYIKLLIKNKELAQIE